MKLKLNHTEFMAMLKMFAGIVLSQQPANAAQKMHKALMMQVYEKLYKTAIRNRTTYLITLSVAEAIAFWFFWQQHEFKDTASYEANLVRTTNNIIHQKLIA